MSFSYNALNLSGNNQFYFNSKKTIAKNNEINYEDGLSLKEMKKIDKDNDGIITEKEFLETTKLSQKDWQNYLSSYTKTILTNKQATKSKSDWPSSKALNSSEFQKMFGSNNYELIDEHTIRLKNSNGSMNLYTINSNGQATEQKL